MSVVSVSTRIAASPEAVWNMVMDPHRLADWVSIHRRLVRAGEGQPRVGYEMDQQIHVRGVNLEVHWRLVECRPMELAIWEGTGPARSRARTEYMLSPDGEGTRFDYRNEFHAPLGPVGAMVSRALVGGMPEREARRTLNRLQSHLENGS
jgi:carbon monoxide dehydrogenase subunit G